MINVSDLEGQFHEDGIKFPENKNIFIIVGGNNSGKSTLLRSVAKTFNQESHIVNVNRTVLDGEGALSTNYLQNLPAYRSEFQHINDDNSKRSFQALQDFFNLKDVERAPIIEWYNAYFQNKIYEQRENLENSASSMLLKVNGYSITKQGSGMRATLEIFIQLFNPNIKYLCIDEPELGLEPYLQKYLFQAIKDRASSEKKIFLATHSHHFLDYEDSTNNYVCCRASNGKIYLEESDLQQIIFRLLGNTLSSLLLPENIVVLEGPSDTLFLSKCFSILNKVKYAIHSSGSDSNINYAINSITQFLQFNKGNSVYKNNIYVIADQAKDSLVRLWERMLPDAKKQLKVLSLNGIEHYYPARILQEIFDTSDSPSKIVGGFLKNKPTQYNGKNFSKVELAKLVSEKLIESDLAENDNELFDFIKKLP